MAAVLPSPREAERWDGRTLTVLYRVLRMRLNASDQRLSPERALEIARRIQYHQVTLHRQQTATGLTLLSMEQRDLFEAIELPEPSTKKL